MSRSWNVPRRTSSCWRAGPTEATRSTSWGTRSALGRSGLTAPIIYAGNKDAADEVERILTGHGKDVEITDNVMPEIGVLKVEKVRLIIRELFIRRIVDAKGLRNAERFIDSILMPTPTAVLNAAKLLAEGAEGEPGLGELVILDIGGATTDIHSISLGAPTQPGVIQKGLPEPFVKRTVEGDLGMRHNASTIVAAVGQETFRRQTQGYLPDLEVAVGKPVARPGAPAGVHGGAGPGRGPGPGRRPPGHGAPRRHHGCGLRPHGAVPHPVRQGPAGDTNPDRHRRARSSSGPTPWAVLRETLHSPANPFSLTPAAPAFYIDDKYILYAVGLMAEVYPAKALRIAKKYLRNVQQGVPHGTVE